MIEPTESEVKAELDRLCEALIAIRGEIRINCRRPATARGQCSKKCSAHGIICDRGRVDEAVLA
jgi:glycine cleavage system protein P-like pyridoxal-binding family